MKEVFTVSEYTKDGEKKSRWTKVGVAFPNKDGSLSVLLEALPVNGRLQIRDPRPKDGDRAGARSYNPDADPFAE